jgi:hypothetical protein
MDNFIKLRDSMINTIDQINGSEEYLTFFTMCIDNLALNEISSILTGELFSTYEDYEANYNQDTICEDDTTYNYLKELEDMAKEDINVINIDPKLEIVEYSHMNEYLNNKLCVNGNDFLDKNTILHNLVSLSKLGKNQKLWLYQDIKQVDVSHSYRIFRWLCGQSSIKIIPCILLTIQSALQENTFDDEIKKYLLGSINGINNLIEIYPENEDLINLKILIKSKI